MDGQDHTITTIDALESLYSDSPYGPALIKETGHITAEYRKLIEAAPFVVLATNGPEGLDCSPRGDPPGFVRVVDEHTLLIPDRRGNNRIDSLRNLVTDPRVSLIFLIPGVSETLRVMGRVTISTDPELCASFAMQGKAPRCVLVIAVEQERNVPGGQAPGYLGAAAWVGHEGQDAKYMWPYMFSQLADEYDRRYGLDDAHLHAIAELNMGNAKANPLAQTRGWSHPPGGFSDDDTDNPVVEGRLRRTDCAQVTDGSAGLLLVSDEFGARLGARPAARIAGWGHGTAGLALQPKFDRSQGEPYVFPHVRQVVTDAFGRAGIAGVGDLDGIETHDCFSMSEYMAIDHFGITEPGESWKAVENGELERDGAIPVNPSGGLIGVGHPVGATGVRMLHDAARQVTGQAGDCQVDGARTFATLNIGGSLTTTVSFVVAAG